MAKSRRKRGPKTVLKLPDLEQSKSAVLNSLASASSKRSYDHAIRCGAAHVEFQCCAPLGSFLKGYSESSLNRPVPKPRPSPEGRFITAVRLSGKSKM